MTAAALALQRTRLERLARELPTLDFQILLRLVLLADPITGTLTSSWDGLASELGLIPPLVRASVSRLAKAKALTGEVDQPDGVHLHLGDLLSLRETIPANLPVEEPL